MFRSLRLAGVLTQQSNPVPGPITGEALLDTGASISAVDSSTIQTLGISPTGSVKLHTPSGPSQRNQYAVSFEFPGTGLPPIPTILAVDAVLQPQGIIALIGRDVLAALVLVYNGPVGMITLAL